MIRVIEALYYRCLKYVNRSLGNFHVLVGPNASGKTTFLDVVGFLGDLVTGGLEKALEERSRNFHDLVWQRTGNRFELAVELAIPNEQREKLSQRYESVRYEVAVGPDPATNEVSLLAERAVLLGPAAPDETAGRTLFPMEPSPPNTILTGRAPRGGRSVSKTVVSKNPAGNDNFYDETGRGWDHSFRLGPRKSALANLPDDETKFPAGTWLKRLLCEGVQRLVLNSALMRHPSPPGQPRRFRPDGSNIPWVVQRLRKEHPHRLREWVAHLRTALPDLVDVYTVERPEDRHCYLVLRYNEGLEIPSWTASDGTLRLLALTLPAYLGDVEGVYLIEEPENGIHPRAVETMFDSLSSVYGAQILLATHSPVILSVARPESILCFAKSPGGATDVVLGTEHPRLREWRGETNLGVLFAGGVLG